jgi:molybdenum cofactor cytidylyltransferase
MKNVGIVILAAGASTRMGRPKQLLPLNGQPLLLHTIDEALSTSVSDVVVVLGSDPDTYKDLLETYPVDLIVNDTWRNGIGSSIKTGLISIKEKAKGLDAILILVGDQPAISFEYLCRMINTFQNSSTNLIASGYSDTYGVPALFGREFFQEIMNIEDGEGAKAILRKHEHQLTVLECPEGAVDIDTPQDYAAFRRQFQA